MKKWVIPRRDGPGRMAGHLEGEDSTGISFSVKGHLPSVAKKVGKPPASMSNWTANWLRNCTSDFFDHRNQPVGVQRLGKDMAIALDDIESGHEAGEITLKLVSATEATNQGERLYDVCGADSAVLEAIYATLFDTNGETKEDLDIEPGWNNLLFIDDMKIEPEFQDTLLRVQLIETSIAVFCPEGLIVAVEESLDLKVEDWRRLGFKRIAESPFVFRDQLRVNPYRKSEREGSAAVGPDEASYICNSCGEEIVVPFDLSAGSNQEYVEDCPVCCRSNVVHVEIADDGEVRVWAEPEQDYE